MQFSLTQQVDWEQYGIDWDGEASLRDDTSVVTVEELSDILTEEQRQEFHSLVCPADSVVIEDDLLHRYVIAKTFVHSCQT